MRHGPLARLAFLSLAAALLLATAAQKPTPRPPCCFTHRSHAGVCKVQPARDETCASILAYLNDPRSQGKAYCSSTTLRGGWEEVACDARSRR
jgi:hypothetical protein